MGWPRKPYGEFVHEEYCPACHAAADLYENERGYREHADPDTGLVVTHCPQCGVGVELFGRRGEVAE